MILCSFQVLSKVIQLYMHAHIYVCIYMYFSDTFPYRLLENVDCNSLMIYIRPLLIICVLHVVVCICQYQTLSLSPPHVLRPFSTSKQARGN